GTISDGSDEGIRLHFKAYRTGVPHAIVVVAANGGALRATCFSCGIVELEATGFLPALRAATRGPSRPQRHSRGKGRDGFRCEGGARRRFDSRGQNEPDV